MRTKPHKLDAGVRKAVEHLNAIDGVTTRASCEGRATATGHPHSTLAYVTFDYPLPPRLRDFLVSALTGIARVDDDAIYSRRPGENRRFLELLTEASGDYGKRCTAPLGSLVFRLDELRTALMTPGAAADDAVVVICPRCGMVTVDHHECDNLKLALDRWPAGFSAAWFADFSTDADNRLDPALHEVLGPAELEERTRRGDFGVPYRRRWLRYRDARGRREIVRALCDGVQRLRAAGIDFDVSFDGGEARVTWHHAPPQFRR